MLWKYFQNCMHSFREIWKINLRICYTVCRFNSDFFTIERKSKVLFQCRSEITWATVYGFVAWFPLVRWGKVNRTDFSTKDFSLIGSFSFYICCSLPVAPRQQIFYSEICFFISYVPLVLKHLGIFVTVICWWNINTSISFHYRLFPRKANVTKFFKKSQKPYFGPGLRRTLSLFQYLNYLPTFVPKIRKT